MSEFTPTQKNTNMPRVFEITPKRIKRTNNTVLTPEIRLEKAHTTASHRQTIKES